MKIIARRLALATAALAAGMPAPSQAADAMALGRHLSQECTSCHRLDGVDNGIPSIVGRTAEEVVASLTLYRSGQGKNPAMVSVAQSLDDEQIRAIALYLSSLPQRAPATPAAPANSKPRKP